MASLPRFHSAGPSLMAQVDTERWLSKPTLPLAESIVPADDDVPERLQTRSTRPTTVAGDAGSAGAVVAAELEVDVAALAIHAHPDFSAEDHLFVGLRQLYGGYRHRIETNLAEHYSQRLDALLSQLESMIERHDDAAM